MSLTLADSLVLSNMEFRLQLLKQLRFAVDKVVHHDNIMSSIVVRSWGNVARLDPDRRDAGVIKLDAEKGHPPISRGSRNESSVQQATVSAEVFDERGRWVVGDARARRAVWLINICEHRAESPDSCRGSAIGTRYDERRDSDVAPHRREQPRGAERFEDLAVACVTKQ